MPTQTLQDGSDPFQVTFHPGPAGSPVVLFAVGAGGLPERHATLLATLVARGCTVVAPHFERLASTRPTKAELSLRGRRLSLALDALAPPGSMVVGVGHSIGAATLLAMAGAQMWLGPGLRVGIVPDPRLRRLALMAAPTGFFQAPQALDALQVPVLAWAGTEDAMTPPAQSQWLADALRHRQPVDLRITAGAGHFSFMDMGPPHSPEPLADKPAFLRDCSNVLATFLLD
ncbi:alpha/beta hydrolase family protein [Ideonella sp.]|uniref:alpha/beta hydrolase family protein n=1 Tax=Ideonella sp. TaxID=1929293 RepID=UPI003BB782CC